MDVTTARWSKDLRKKFKKERKKLRRVRASKAKIQKSLGTLKYKEIV